MTKIPTAKEVADALEKNPRALAEAAAIELLWVSPGGGTRELQENASDACNRLFPPEPKKLTEPPYEPLLILFRQKIGGHWEGRVISQDERDRDREVGVFGGVKIKSVSEPEWDSEDSTLYVRGSVNSRDNNWFLIGKSEDVIKIKKAVHDLNASRGVSGII